MLLGAFRPPKPDNRVCCDTHWMVTSTSLHDAGKFLVPDPRERP
jgi:hypothetical protein